MKILSVNAGSSSLKFQLFEIPAEKELVSGVFEKIGMDGSFYSYKINGNKVKNVTKMPTHSEAVKLLIHELIEQKVITSLDEINAVGHRIVHGGSVYSDSVILDEAAMNTIDQLSELAPLHNPANLLGVKAFKEILGDVPAVGVFDTAFHQTMPASSYIYATPYEWYTDHGVRKYGFHGTSHKYVSERLAEMTGKNDLNIITCHLGNGGSLAAVKAGKSIDTTMGFTPLAGIMMGTRSGDIDSAIIPFIMEKENKTAAEVINDLNKKSGLLGVSGVSSDARDIEDGIAAGNERARLAQDIYNKRVVAYISEFNTLLGGADAIVFTAGLGENGIDMREEVCTLLAPIGVDLDKEANNIRSKETLITKPDSKIKAYIVPTNEEVMIARDTYRLAFQGNTNNE